MGETIEIRGNCLGDQRISGEEYTLLKGKLDDEVLNETLRLMNNEYSHLFVGTK